MGCLLVRENPDSWDFTFQGRADVTNPALNIIICHWINEFLYTRLIGQIIVLELREFSLAATALVNMDLDSDQVVNEGTPDSDNEEQNYRRSLVSLHRTLRQETLCNVETLKASLDDLSEQSQLLYSVFCQLFDHLENIDGVLIDILDFAPQYDFHHQKINGYRSQVKVTQRCLTRLMALVRHITVNQDSYMFRRSHYVRELESYVMVLGQLRDVLHYTRKLVDYTPPGQLIPDEAILDTKLGDEIQMEMDKIDQEWFYGRPLGFQVSIAAISLKNVD